MPFTENFYSQEQLAQLITQVQRAADLQGAVVELGCWEGKSTVSIAVACYPAILHAVDHWRGNEDERPDKSHPSVAKASVRNIYQTFLINAREMTAGNLSVHRQAHLEFLASTPLKIKFCHVDGSHDYVSVERTLRALLPLLVPQAIVCGDDFKTAHAGRTDLGGGVERAVREVLPGFDSFKNFWWWQNPGPPTLIRVRDELVVGDRLPGIIIENPFNQKPAERVSPEEGTIHDP